MWYTWFYPKSFKWNQCTAAENMPFCTAKYRKRSLNFVGYSSLHCIHTHRYENSRYLQSWRETHVADSFHSGLITKHCKCKILIKRSNCCSEVGVLSCNLLRDLYHKLDMMENYVTQGVNYTYSEHVCMCFVSNAWVIC